MYNDSLIVVIFCLKDCFCALSIIFFVNILLNLVVYLFMFMHLKFNRLKFGDWNHLSGLFLF